MQPLGGLDGLGRSPFNSIGFRFLSDLGLGIGTAEIKESVYG